MSQTLRRAPLPDGLQPAPNILDSLRNVAIFTDIRESNDAMVALGQIMKEREFTAGSSIIEEGEEGTEMFILIAGQASVYKKPPGGDEYKVAIFSGEKQVAFGESGLVEGELRSASIRADVDCRCLALSRGTFEEFSKTHPQWALPIYRRIALSVMTRLRKINNDMLLLYNALVAEIRGH